MRVDALRFNRTEVNFQHLVASDTVTQCPYKGTTGEYWSISVAGNLHNDLVWAHDFPTRHLATIAGLVSFYNEKVDIFIEGVLIERAVTHVFS